MIGTYKIAAFLFASAIVAGCTPDPAQYETTPVQVETANGTVTCQLYTKDTVLWDRALDWPRSMDYKQADAICKTEGKRQAG